MPIFSSGRRPASILLEAMHRTVQVNLGAIKPREKAPAERPARQRRQQPFLGKVQKPGHEALVRRHRGALIVHRNLATTFRRGTNSIE
jgi:hypothetical protein